MKIFEKCGKKVFFVAKKGNRIAVYESAVPYFMTGPEILWDRIALGVPQVLGGMEGKKAERRGLRTSSDSLL